MQCSQIGIDTEQLDNVRIWVEKHSQIVQRTPGTLSWTKELRISIQSGETYGP